MAPPIPPQLIVVYAGYGDTLILKFQKSSNDSIEHWLIDGGPVTSSPTSPTKIDGTPGRQGFHAYYQYLRQALLRFCCSDPSTGIIDKLNGIIVTHPDRDHMDGIIQLLGDWLPGPGEKVSSAKGLKFDGPVILNDLFFKRNKPGQHYLFTLLKKKGFSKTLYGGPAVGSSKDLGMEMNCVNHPLHEMNRRPTHTSSSKSIRKRWVVTIDDSPTNISSIITSWRDPNFPDLPIMTTGDAIGSHILNYIKTLQVDLGIFKVPHHGSQRNSIIDPSYTLKDATSKRENDHHFFLALTAWYVVGKGKGQGQIDSRVKNDIIDNFSSDWINVVSDDHPRSKAEFYTVLDDLSDRFFEFIQAYDFEYTSPTTPNFTLKLGDIDDLTKFVVLLAKRQYDILDGIYKDNSAAAQTARSLEYLKDIKPAFKTENFDWFPLVPPNNPVEHDPRYVSLCALLSSDPGAMVSMQMGILSFYEAFRANNYVISANGMHGHPNHSLIAGIIAAAVIRNDKSSQQVLQSRIFVTDAAPLEADIIISIVADLLRSRSISGVNWEDSIHIFHLDTDYCAAIPLDLTPDVQGCTRLKFDTVDITSRRTLHNEFIRTAAYDLPRASDPVTSSFAMYAVDGTDNRLRYDANAKFFKHDDTTTFTFRFEGAGDSTDKSTLNKRLYVLYCETDTGRFVPLGTKVLFQECRGSSSAEGVTFNMLNELGEVLSPDVNDVTIFTFQQVTSPPTGTRLRFKRKVGLGAVGITPRSGSSPVTRMPIQSALRPVAPFSRLSLPSKSFESWWKRVGPKDPPSVVTLADVAKVVLGDSQAQAVLARVPSAPFLFADVAQWSVDIKRSPAVVKDAAGSVIVTCHLVLNAPIIVQDIAGLGSGSVGSVSAVLSVAAGSFRLEAEMEYDITTSCSFLFVSPLDLYLRAIGYSGSSNRMAIATLGATIVGADVLWGFFAALPSSVTTVIGLPTWWVDISKTKIAYSPSPLGIDVSSAEVFAAVPSSISQIDIGGFRFSVVKASLVFTSNGDGSFVIGLTIDLHVLASSVEIDLHLTASNNSHGPTVLDFMASSRSSLSDFLTFLGLTVPTSTLSLPLGGKSVDFHVALDYVGFTLIQPCTGTMSMLELQDIYFRVSVAWEPWKKVLPTTLQPEHGSDTALTVVIRRPRTDFAVGLQLDYMLTIDLQYAPLRFRMSYWPIKGRISPSGLHQRTSIAFYTDTKRHLPPPQLGAVLSKFTSGTWKDVADALPLLDTITNAITVTNASLEIGDDKSITAFSVTAQVLNLPLLKKPSLVIDKARLTLDYNGSSWTGRLATQLLFAGQFCCATQLDLPTPAIPGTIKLKNLHDEFTLSKFVKEIDPNIDLKTVPIIGGDVLSTSRLDHASVDIAYEKNALSIISFKIGVTWGSQAIGQLNTSSSMLTIGWQKAPLASVPSIEGPGHDDITKNTWVVQWEGQISADWHLSAQLQYSNIQSVQGVSSRLLVVSGAILNVSGMTEAKNLVNSLVTSQGSSTQSTIWQDTLPSNISGTFMFRQCAINYSIGEKMALGVAGQAIWGKTGTGIGIIFVEKLQPPPQTGPQWAFTLAIGVSFFKFTDLIRNTPLAQMVDRALMIVDVSILVFCNPNGATLAHVKQGLENVVACNMLPRGTDTLPLEDIGENLSTQFTSGAVLVAAFDFVHAPSGSLTANLAFVSTSTLPRIEIMGYFGKASDSTTAVTFKASISSLPIFSSVCLKDITLTYSPVVPSGSGGAVSNTFSINATCEITFSPTSSWSILGSFILTKTDVNFVFSLTSGSLTLSETLGLTISAITFSGQYKFSDSAPTDTHDNVIQHGDRWATYTLQLSGQVKFGNVKSTVSVLFLSGSPSVLIVQVPGVLRISALINQLFVGDKGLPEDGFDVAFSNLFAYYAWVIPIKQTTPKGSLYQKGFHAEADANVYGVHFSLMLDIIGGENGTKGIRIKGSKKKPVKVICLILHDRTITSVGPSFGLSTCTSDSGCFVEAGLTLFGTYIGFTTLSYNPTVPRFLGNVVVRGDFIPGGSATVSIELVRKGGKYCLRFVDLPAVFDDLIQAIKIIEEIEKLSAAEGSCGPIMLAFDELVKSTVSVHIVLSDSQGGTDPSKSLPDINTISFDVTGHFNLLIGNTSIAGIDFAKLTFTGKIPTSLTSLGENLAQFLQDSASVIVKGLWDNKDKLAQVVGLVALKELSAQAIQALICRGYYKPPVNPADLPNDNQSSDVTDDGGGADGDIGGFTVSTSMVELLGGTALAAAALEMLADGALGAFSFIVLGLVGSILAVITRIPFHLSKPPSPEKPVAPADDDQYGTIIFEAINKDFERWTLATDFDTALQTCLDCALDYRTAIGLLRKVLRSSVTAPLLGQKAFRDYTIRRTFLVYSFSSLRTRFAAKWLDASQVVISIRFIPTTTGRKLQVTWSDVHPPLSMLTTLTLYINGGTVIRLEVFDKNVMTMDGPPFDLKGTNITAEVAFFAAIQGGDPAYAFFSIGKPATNTYVELPPTITTMDASLQPTAPNSLSYHNITAPDSVETDASHYPVFQVGEYTYWALSPTDSSVVSFTILAFRKDGTVFGKWEKAGAHYICSIKYKNETVTFIGQSKKSISFNVHNLLFSPISPTVTTGDANFQPGPPLGLKYKHITDANSDDNDLANYPVFQKGRYTYWALSYSNGNAGLTILAYDQNSELSGKWEGSSVKYLYRIILQTSSVSFVGQSNQSVAFSLKALESSVIPFTTSRNANRQPRPPDGVKYIHIPDANSEEKENDLVEYPVLQIGSYTYWALSYANEEAFAIVAFDQERMQRKSWKITGARWLYKINLTTSKSVAFVGKGNMSVSLNLDKLTVS